MEVAIIGGGNFGTAIANIIAANGHTTHLWMRDAEQAADVARLRAKTAAICPAILWLPVLTQPLTATAAAAAELLAPLHCPPRVFAGMGQIAPYVRPQDVLIGGTKNMDADGFRLMSQLLEQHSPVTVLGCYLARVAEEIADSQYAGRLWPAQMPRLALVPEVMRNERLQVYVSADLYGVELGGALKNIYAIICGSAGLGVGQVQGYADYPRVGRNEPLCGLDGGNPFTFLGLSGVGDLLVTCSSPLSRNYQLGFKMANGMSLEDAADALGKLAEGVNTSRSRRKKMSSRSICPWSRAYQLLFEQRDMAEIIEVLMSANEGMDVEFADHNIGDPAECRQIDSW